MQRKLSKFLILLPIAGLVGAFFACDLQLCFTLEYLKSSQQAFAEFYDAHHNRPGVYCLVSQFEMIPGTLLYNHDGTQLGRIDSLFGISLPDYHSPLTCSTLFPCLPEGSSMPSGVA